MYSDDSMVDKIKDESNQELLSHYWREVTIDYVEEQRAKLFSEVTIFDKP
jgi:hypothetical protein